MTGVTKERKQGEGMTGRKSKGRKEGKMGKSDKFSHCQLLLSSYEGQENRFSASQLPSIHWPTGNSYYSRYLAGCGYGLDTTDPQEVIGYTLFQ